MIKQLNYFGTNLTSSGHYYWSIGDGFYSYTSLQDSLTWNPEGLTKGYQNGLVTVITINVLNIIAIDGSPYDRRPGSKSIFWADRNTKFIDLKEAILTLKASKAIIEQMPFEVRWTF